jgi:nitrogen regulatory protein P-II 2
VSASPARVGAFFWGDWLDWLLAIGKALPTVGIVRTPTPEREVVPLWAAGYVDGMKLIIAIIQPSKLESVKAALTEVEVFRLTVMDCQGFGRQKGHTEVYRGHEFAVNLLRKVQLQIAVNEEFVEPTISAIIKGARTGPKGEVGDGKIFVLPLEDCIRIRTGERGGEAI